MSQRKSNRAALKAVDAPALSQINQDRKRVKYLAACIFPGDGFRPSESDSLGEMLLEVVTIITKYDNPEDRDFLIFAIGEAIYPTTFEGQGVIDAFINRAGRAQKGAVRR